MSSETPSLLGRLFWWLPFGQVPEITAQQLLDDLTHKKSSIQIIDVRSDGEWAQGHIVGTINIPVSELKARLSTLSFEKDKPVVAICLSATRSIPAVRLLKIHGFQDVTQLAGGMNAWRRLGLKEETI